MFSFHKPKIYRSITGCCICRAKSSSSRFTDSKKYENEFEQCFRMRERRAGEICNACVLLVKRWKKLPTGTNRHWHHVVDARAGPGTKSVLKIKRRSPTNNKYKSMLTSRPIKSISGPNFADDLAGDVIDDYTDSEESENEDCHSVRKRCKMNKKKTVDAQISSFLDLSYWRKTQVCCGIIFKGINGEVLVDPQLLRPCWSCRKEKISHKDNQTVPSPDDTDSNISTPSYSEIDFPNSASTMSNVDDTEEDLSIANLHCNETLDSFSANHALSLEC